jgi:hypothetical protein
VGRREPKPFVFDRGEGSVVPPIGAGTLRIIPLGGQEEVGRNMTIFEYENVFWFEISVHYFVIMKVLHSQDETTKYKTYSFLPSTFEVIKPRRSLIDESIGVTPLSPLHNKVKIEFISKSIVESCNKVVLRLL